MGAHRFIWCHIQSNNFKTFLLPKVSERASLQIPMTLESTVSPANFDQRFTDCLKVGYITAQRQPEAIKSKRLLS